MYIIKSKETSQTSYKEIDKSDLEPTYFWQTYEPS